MIGNPPAPHPSSLIAGAVALIRVEIQPGHPLIARLESSTSRHWAHDWNRSLGLRILLA